MYQKIKFVVSFIIILFLFYSCSSDNKNKTTSSGYNYVHHIKNDGELPNPGDYVFFEMEVFNDSGKILQNMRDLPNMPSFQILDPSMPHYRLNPINEMMSKMSIGDSATLCYPIDSLRTIPQTFKNSKDIFYSLIIRDIKDLETHRADLKIESDRRKEKMEIVKAMEPEMKALVTGRLNMYKNGEFDDQIFTTETGLKYVIHEKGSGDLPIYRSQLSVHYFGLLMNGTTVDNSYKIGNPYLFTVGEGKVIAGWDEALALFNKGTIASLIVPYTLAYGVAGRPGSIPEKADLFFYVEIENIYNY